MADVHWGLRLGDGDGPPGQIEHGAEQGFELGALIVRRRESTYRCLEIRRRLLQTHDRRPLQSLYDDLEPLFGTRHLLDDGARADGKKVFLL